MQDVADHRLALDGVTLCAVDCVLPGLALEALHRSLRGCRFDEALLLTSARPAAIPDGIRVVPIAPLDSRHAYSRFVLHDLHRHVGTPHVLLVQWDGFVLDPAAWNDAFLDYDYVGATWRWHRTRRVGNGGFSLRSTRLLRRVARLAPRDTGVLGEDEIVCRVLGERLEQGGMRFAPEAVADRFSYERDRPEAPTFGFHGLFELWRHVEPGTLHRIAAQLPDAIVRGQAYSECMIGCYNAGRIESGNVLCQRLTASVGQGPLPPHLSRLRDVLVAARRVAGAPG